ncbi:uncharacterized protein LOC9632807 isoform X1 [Selaginella moellendorffii]|uniref:uncharacterized protein LOC9632807 isoform X1 n=1 Tax=Selaginella moellendorffii TaxID=88036 RepID=UPI000D1C8E97|nr:uncharacterized protein LOC9632807 isoform X1 [Selaginella moellendorffii]|eukprot:XP_002967581.2 uncharacterized protein LOC9632807 isoform X1 [Selaginella moellendorffii]
MMLVSDDNVLGNYRRGTGISAISAGMEQQHKLGPNIEEGFHSGRSVQTWQCFPDGGSLSSIDSLPPIEDDESGTDQGMIGSPAMGRLDYDSGGQNRSREEASPPRVKLMCSFGGRILPRPSDGKLRYVGGETRIVSLKRDVSYAELMLKMKKHYGEDLSLKYQLPNEDLDALISVSTDEDLQNMMEEYDRLEDNDGLQRLRVFLFSVADGESLSIDPLDPRKSEQWYVEAVNGLLETGSRKSESGVSGGGISARPSAENLVALDATLEEQLLAKKLQGAFNSASSSPALVPQQPYARNLGGHAYGMFASEGQQQHFGNLNTDVGHFDLDHYYPNSRAEVTHDHDRILRGYPHETKMPRVGSHGKLSRLQEQQLDDSQQQHFGNLNTDVGHFDLDHYYPNSRAEVTHDHDRILRGYPHETKMPRVGSHGKLSRLQEQQLDDSQQQQQQQDLLPHDLFMEPRPRFVVQPPQPHRQHPLDSNQDYRRPEFQHSDSGFPHMLQHQQAQPVMYLKDPVYRAEAYHRHQLPDDYQGHDFIQHEDYCPGHMYQRNSNHGDGGGMGAHSAPYQIGSSPSSPRLAYRDGRLHPQLSVHRPYPGNPVDHQYGRRPHTHEESGRSYRLSSSPPRYRDHHLDEPLPFLHHHERFPSDQVAMALMFDKKQGPEMLPRQAMGLYGPGYQENSFYYPDNGQRGGEPRRQVKTSPHLNPRFDYQDHLVQMEQLSLHGHQPEVERNLEAEDSGLRNQKPLIEPEPRQAVTNSLPFVVHGSGIGPSSQVPPKFMDSQPLNRSSTSGINTSETGFGSRWMTEDETPDLLTDAGSSARVNIARPSSNNNLTGLVSQVGSAAQSQQASAAYSCAPSVSLPIFDTISQWNRSIGAGDLEASAVKSEIDDDASRKLSHMMSETGHLAEDMVSSVLRSNYEFPATSSNFPVQKEIEPVQELDLVPQPTLTVQNWDKVLCRDEEPITENEACREHTSVEAHDKAEGSHDSPPPGDISLAAEQEAKSRGLQIIKNSDLEEIRELGSGTYGTVYHGKWRGTDVAIKRIKASCFEGRPVERDRLILDFWREAGTLSKLHHPNVVAFYGVVPDGPGGTLATVTEYMVNGSLKQVLQKKDRTIDRRKRLLIATDAAFGMEYLHGKNIVHFDLKCENLLVNMRDPHRPVCKVGDLGLSKVKRQTMVSGGVRGTLPWMAPELLSTSSCMVSERVDVFSFGIVMWELLTGEEPYANMHYGAIIGGIVSNTLRPPIPNWCEPAWRSLMERCWDADPSARPSFAEIASELRSMSSSLQPRS